MSFLILEEKHSACEKTRYDGGCRDVVAENSRADRKRCGIVYDGSITNKWNSYIGLASLFCLHRKMGSDFDEGKHLQVFRTWAIII